MNIGTIVLIILLCVIAIPLVLALFASDHYSVARTVTINKPKQDVFDYVRMLKNQSHYSKWVMMDPDAKMDYKGEDGTVGFVSAWDSKNKKVGQGEQQITKIVDGERMDLDIHFIRPFEGHSSAYFATESVSPNQTKVTWEFDGKLNYIMKVFHLLMNMEKMIGSDLQTGLDNLKGVLEKQ